MQGLPFKAVWACSPSRLIRLGDLVKFFKVDVLLDIVADLYELAAIAEREPRFADQRLPPEHVNESVRRMDDSLVLCRDFRFEGPIQHAQRIKKTLESGNCTYGELKTLVLELRSRIQDEFTDVQLLWIEDAEFYDYEGEHFGDTVAQQFKNAIVDVSEAGCCYATGRYTGCVFHLMRVAECGLNAIAKRIGYPDPRPTWEPVLKYLDAELKKGYDEMSQLFKGDIEFLSGIGSHMHDVNLAWRRRVAHIEKVYTKEQARRIYDATKGLMQHLAEKISD